jgi:hypothetical protein
MIKWDKYVDHIFCLQYLHNNRLNEITKTLTNLGINVYDSKFFSFVYDYEHCIFMNQYQNMKEESFNFFNNNVYFEGSYLENDKHNYIFYLGFNTYRTLKIAQYFNYDRIIIFEDDIKFLKDTDYIIKAMDFVKEQDFDICMCQTTFMDAWHGIKSYLVEDGCQDFGNDMFLKTELPLGIYGGGFIILTNKGINKIVDYYENHNLMVCLDALDTLRDKMQLSTLFALKPLCIQRNMIDEWSEEQRKEENINMIIEEYEYD